MIILDLLAMTPANKASLLGVVVLFSLIPLAILDANPGIGLGGWIQLSIVVLVVSWMGVRFARLRTGGRLVCWALSYPFATAVSNIAAFMLISDLMH